MLVLYLFMTYMLPALVVITESFAYWYNSCALAYTVLKTNTTNGKKGFNLISVKCLMGLKTLVVDSFETARLQYSNKFWIVQILPYFALFWELCAKWCVCYFYKQFSLKIHADFQCVISNAISRIYYFENRIRKKNG